MPDKCQIKCQIECQNACQVHCLKKIDPISEYMSDKMWEDMLVGGNRSNKLSHTLQDKNRVFILHSGGIFQSSNLTMRSNDRCSIISSFHPIPL